MKVYHYLFNIIAIVGIHGEYECDNTECDWRQKNAVREAEDQGACISCWAFGVNTVLEAFEFNQHGVLRNLSKQYMLDCGHTMKRNLGRCLDQTGVASGGDPYDALLVARKLNGLYTNDDYPWRGDDKLECHEIHGKDKYLAGRQFDVMWKKRVSNEELKSIIRNYGPVAVKMAMPGTLMLKDGPHLLREPCTGRIDHVAAIVGYGVDRPTGTPYWILKNSYGTAWRDNGFIRIAMKSDGDKSDCKIREHVYYVTPKNDDDEY